MSGAQLGGGVAALIPAAGLGTRLGRGPKAFVEVGGQSLLARSVAALAPYVDEVIVALPPGSTLPSGVRASVIVGGQTRQDSVRLLLSETQAATVLIHDAARPFLPGRCVTALLSAVCEVGGATLALPVADTLVRAGAGSSQWSEAISREQMWAVQTPQAFERAALLAAHCRAHAEGHHATDDAGLWVWAGGQVRLVMGDARLFKVTTPSDLALAQALAPTWHRVAPYGEGA